MNAPALPRKKSPRAPSMPLNEAIGRAIKVYEKERLQAAPLEVIANAIGYKNANSGTALSALASLRYYGLLERPKDGFLAASKDVQLFLLAPDEDKRRALLIQFLQRPPLYAELLSKYEDGLPSEATMRLDLINRGFSPAFANAALSSFKESVQFAGYFDADSDHFTEEAHENSRQSPPAEGQAAAPHSESDSSAGSPFPQIQGEGLDRIPVRLAGGRKAWLVIPTPFFSADKARLKAQIDFLLTDDEG